VSVIEYQRTIMADRVRNDALARALKALVRKGDTVVDVGAGTGFLAMLARRLGAGQCYLIEEDEGLARLAGETLKRNRMTGCTVIHAHSSDVTGLPKADLVVSETLGNYAYEESIIEGLGDARRFLKPKGRVMPAALAQHAVPVVTDKFYKEISSWDRVGMELDFTAAKSMSLNNMYVKEIRPADLLGGVKSSKVWDEVDFTRGDNSSVRRGNGEWTAAEATTVYGLALWWTCTLAPGIELTTSPSAPATHWKQIFLPAAAPIDLARGDRVSATIRSDTRPRVKVNVAWELSRHAARGAAGAIQRLDMKKGR
jgi:protein arginine N-methyltransferase 1